MCTWPHINVMVYPAVGEELLVIVQLCRPMIIAKTKQKVLFIGTDVLTICK